MAACRDEPSEALCSSAGSLGRTGDLSGAFDAPAPPHVPEEPGAAKDAAKEEVTPANLREDLRLLEGRLLRRLAALDRKLNLVVQDKRPEPGSEGQPERRETVRPSVLPLALGGTAGAPSLGRGGTNSLSALRGALDEAPKARFTLAPEPKKSRVTLAPDVEAEKPKKNRGSNLSTVRASGLEAPVTPSGSRKNGTTSLAVSTMPTGTSTRSPRPHLPSVFSDGMAPEDGQARGSRLTRIGWHAWGTSDLQISPLRRVMSRLGVLSSNIELPANFQSAWGWKLIHSTSFQLLASTFIVLNAIFVGYVAAGNMQAILDGRDVKQSTGADVVEVMFEVIFALELLVRIAAEGVKLFFLGPEWKWNLFDLALVLISLFDSILSLAGSTWSSDITIGRLLRLLRFMRLTRIMRVLRHFSSLRLVVFSILDSMSSLLWCFLIIAVIIYIFGIILMSATVEHYYENNKRLDGEVGEQLNKNFGTLGRSVLTLFFVITGGVDWGDVYFPLNQVSFLYGCMILVYIFGMCFGVLNVIVGAFCAKAADIAAKDREVVVRREMEQMQVITGRIKTFFQEADIDNSGTLSWDEFKEHLGRKEVKAYFNSMDLDVSQAHHLFNLLDTDHNDEVNVTEFLDGCMRLKGPARNIDMNVLLAEQQKVRKQVRFLSRLMQECNCSLDYLLGKEYGSEQSWDPESPRGEGARRTEVGTDSQEVGALARTLR